MPAEFGPRTLCFNADFVKPPVPLRCYSENANSMNLSFENDIQASPEAVFDLVSDIEHLDRWMDGLQESEYLSEFDAADPVGARFHQRVKSMGRDIEYDGEILECERPTRFALRISNRQFTIKTEYHLSRNDSGTHLEYSSELAKASLKFRLLATAFSFLAEKTLAKQMKKLKALAEASR